jgi:hypothetical protein
VNDATQITNLFFAEMISGARQRLTNLIAFVNKVDPDAAPIGTAILARDLPKNKSTPRTFKKFYESFSKQVELATRDNTVFHNLTLTLASLELLTQWELLLAKARAKDAELVRILREDQKGSGGWSRLSFSGQNLP